MDKLTSVRNLRTANQRAFQYALRYLLSESGKSEVELRDLWLNNLRRYDIFPDGWYIPPEHGIGVVFGSDNDLDGLNFHTLRSTSVRNYKFLDDRAGLAYVYASPVGGNFMIGDFGMTIYFGQDSMIINHLKACHELNMKIYEHMQVGMTFGEVYEFADKLIKDKKLTNDVLLTTDPSAVNVIGHTVPSTEEPWTQEELKQLNSKDWDTTRNIISKKRKYITKGEQLKIKQGMAITIEPRLRSSVDMSVPMCSFHTTAIFSKEKEHLTGFDEIFKFVGMDYL